MMKYASMKEAEKDFNDKLKTDFTNLLQGTIREFSGDELRTRVEKFLSNNCIGTLATCSDNIPRATPVRYRSRGLTLYVLTEGGGKVYNIQCNADVGFSVYGNYSGFKTVRGLQIWGQAQIIDRRDETAYKEAYAVLNLDERADLQDIQLEEVQSEMVILKIVPERIRFLSLPQGILNSEVPL